ncbi:MAG: hypothetical protein OER04_01525 [Cyclobacteriaceae bacterium]|nr:hypothetical protein [Cyclobacteriaceae bacterium]
MEIEIDGFRQIMISGFDLRWQGITTAQEQDPAQSKDKCGEIDFQMD